MPSTSLPLRRVFTSWWPLAASWLLMSAEGPALSMVVARLANPEINLAAYGGVVFPLALIIESPIIMLLAASTALSKDWASYQKVRADMMWAGGILTTLHALVAFTPLYYVVVQGILGAPHEIIEPARLGLKFLLPWTWSIAYRRFHQGVLIRFGRSRAIGLGTAIRLGSDVLVLVAGYLIGSLPGITVASIAVATGVMMEALYVGIVVQPVLKLELRNAPPVEPPLTYAAFWNFYIPLALTSLLTLLSNPLGSAAMGRMPDALASLAVWPVISGLIFMFRSLGIAYNEVVVALLDEAGAYHSLRRFTNLLSLASTAGLLLIAVTPLSTFWFVRLTDLSPQLAELALHSLWITLPLPLLSALQSWYQGALLTGRRTRGITESVVVYLITSAVVLGAGVLWGKTTGLYIGLAALTLSVFTQTVWLGLRAAPVLNTFQAGVIFPQQVVKRPDIE
jgi:hypothetical protein